MSKIQKDKRQKAVDALTKKILSGKPVDEGDVIDILRLARGQVLLTVARHILSGRFEDSSVIETMEYDERGNMLQKERKSRDIIRLFNVLQNAIERHDRMHGQEALVDRIPIEIPGVDFEITDDQIEAWKNGATVIPDC